MDPKCQRVMNQFKSKYNNIPFNPTQNHDLLLCSIFSISRYIYAYGCAFKTIEEKQKVETLCTSSNRASQLNQRVSITYQKHNRLGINRQEVK